MLAAVPSDCCQTTCMLPVRSMATLGAAVMSSVRASRVWGVVQNPPPANALKVDANRSFGVVPEDGWRQATTASPLALIAAAGSAAMVLSNSTIRVVDQKLFVNCAVQIESAVPSLCTQVAMALPEAST